MINILLGKRQTPPGVASQPLAQGVVPAFLMIGHTGSFRDGMMLLGGHSQWIHIELVGEYGATSIALRDGLPQLLSGCLGAISNGIGDNLAGSTTLGGPQPAL